jgi:YggT family protein
MPLLIQLINLLCGLLVIDAILSWVMPSQQQFPRNYTSRVTEPLYAPLRKVIDPQKTGGLDLSPLIWIIGLQVLAGLLGG